MPMYYWFTVKQEIHILLLIQGIFLKNVPNYKYDSIVVVIYVHVPTFFLSLLFEQRPFHQVKEKVNFLFMNGIST
jgi:hypothetical protein